MSNPSSSPSPSPPPNPLAAASSFLQHHLSNLASRFAAPLPALAAARPPGPQGATRSLALAPDEVARALTGTPVFTVCNSSNEFVLVSDPATGLRSLGLLCFRSEDADALLSHVSIPPSLSAPLSLAICWFAMLAFLLMVLDVVSSR